MSDSELIIRLLKAAEKRMRSIRMLHEVASGRDPTKERIFIRGDSEVQYQDFMRVLNKLQDNGFYSVALVGQDVNGGSATPK